MVRRYKTSCPNTKKCSERPNKINQRGNVRTTWICISKYVFFFEHSKRLFQSDFSSVSINHTSALRTSAPTPRTCPSYAFSSNWIEIFLKMVSGKELPSKHTTSFWRWYNVIWTSTTFLQRWNDVVCLLGSVSYFDLFQNAKSLRRMRNIVFDISYDKNTTVEIFLILFLFTRWKVYSVNMLSKYLSIRTKCPNIFSKFILY